MDLREAKRLLDLPEGGDGAQLTVEALRKQYLRLALRTHPDKNPGDPAAGEKFKALSAAHAALLAAVQQGAASRREAERTAALLDLLLRALRGEDVEEKLAALGEYRPPAAFGVDLEVRFDSRVAPHSAGGNAGSHEYTAQGLRQLFREAFQQEGLTEEGDPLGGYELPLEREV